MTKTLQKTPEAAIQPAQPDVAALFQYALENNKGESLRELVALKREMDADAARRAYSAALAAFQAECPPILKASAAKITSRRSGSSFTIKYADLETIGKTVGPHLAKNGLSYTFSERPAPDGFIEMACILRHRDGHSETVTARSPIDDGSTMSRQHQYEATRSFAKRSVLVLALGITTAQDDAIHGGGGEHIDEEQIATIDALLDELGDRVNINAFYRWLGVDSVTRIPKAKYRQTVTYLERKRAE